MVNMTSGTAGANCFQRRRRRRQTWRPQQCRLGKRKGTQQFNDIEYPCQLTAVKTRKLLTTVT